MTPALIFALIIGGVALIIKNKPGWWMIALALVIAAIAGLSE